MRKFRSVDRRRLAAGSVGTLCALLLAAPAPAQKPIAKVEVGKDYIAWHPVVETAGLELTVAGSGLELSRRSKGSEPLRLENRASKTERLADGAYRYVLTALPVLSPELRERLAKARAARERGEAVTAKEVGLDSEPLVQSGTFSIRDGIFVDPEGREPGRKSEQTGDVAVDGALKVRGAKSFVTEHPTETGRVLVYAALEGPEAGTYLRGAARTAGGEAVIELPEHFAGVTEAEGLTVQLTPVGAWSRLYVAEKSPRRLVVRSAESGEVDFDYLIQGVRSGYASFQVERPAPADACPDREEC